MAKNKPFKFGWLLVVSILTEIGFLAINVLIYYQSDGRNFNNFDNGWLIITAASLIILIHTVVLIRNIIVIIKENFQKKYYYYYLYKI